MSKDKNKNVTPLPTSKIPFCDNCGTDEYIIERRGGGFRCENCKRIFDEHHRIIGEIDEPILVTSDDIRNRIEKSHIGKKNDWLVG
jgi:tRNA(Ile2) C34 agmatinyltransferase TiaS